MGSRGAQHLANMLQGNHTLQELHLADCHLVNTCSTYFGRNVCFVKDFMLSLSLGHRGCDGSHHRIKEQRRSSLFGYEPSAALHLPGTNTQRLRSRVRRLNPFVSQEEWAVHVARMLAVNSRLVELHLGTMGMTDAGMENLAEGLMSNHSLRYLDLRW